MTLLTNIAGVPLKIAFGIEGDAVPVDQPGRRQQASWRRACVGVVLPGSIWLSTVVEVEEDAGSGRSPDRRDRSRPGG